MFNSSVLVPKLRITSVMKLAGYLSSVRRGDWRRRLVLDGMPGSAQVMIPATDHHYTGREKELVAAIDNFLSKLK